MGRSQARLEEVLSDRLSDSGEAIDREFRGDCRDRQRREDESGRYSSGTTRSSPASLNPLEWLFKKFDLVAIRVRYPCEFPIFAVFSLINRHAL